jgi:hypothetical protein
LEMEQTQMKLNWRLIIVVVIMVGVVAWVLTSVLPNSYDGTNLSFNVGTGSVTVNNLSDSPAAVQLIGTGTRSFTLSSNIEGVAGTSTREGSGSTSTQLYDLILPPGSSEFTVTRGTNVKFVSSSDTRFEATVQPVSAGESRTLLIVAAVVLLGGLFYVSRSTGHRWMKSLRRQPAPAPVVAAIPLVETPVGDPNRGRDGRMYSNYGGKD